MKTKLGNAMSAILNIIVSPDDLDSLLEQACRSLACIEGFKRVGVALFDTEQKAFVERAVCETEKKDECICSVGEHHIPYSEENLLGQALIHNLPYALMTGKDASDSEIVIPLLSRDNLIGALSIVGEGRVEFSEDILNKLADYGRALSVAVENRILSSSGEGFTSRDTFTGLYSQRYLRARIANEIQRVDRFGGVFSLAIVEIDGFSEFRKKYGFQLANFALKEISRSLSQNLREVDVAARYGEKEFAVLLPHSDREHARLAAVRLQQLVEKIVFESKTGEKVALSVSTGMAVYPDDSPFKDGLLEAADMALARAKESGNSQIMTYAELAREQGIMTSE